jgi:hypothetical protein
MQRSGPVDNQWKQRAKQCAPPTRRNAFPTRNGNALGIAYRSSTATRARPAGPRCRGYHGSHVCGYRDMRGVKHFIGIALASHHLVLRTPFGVGLESTVSALLLALGVLRVRGSGRKFRSNSPANVARYELS